jgi:hypothetical protein
VVVKWSSYCSFPVYIAIAVVMKTIVEKMKAIMASQQ